MVLARLFTHVRGIAAGVPFRPLRSVFKRGPFVGEVADVTQDCADVTQDCADVTQGCADVTQGCADVTLGCADATLGCPDATQSPRRN